MNRFSGRAGGRAAGAAGADPDALLGTALDGAIFGAGTKVAFACPGDMEGG